LYFLNQEIALAFTSEILDTIIACQSTVSPTVYSEQSLSNIFNDSKSEFDVSALLVSEDYSCEAAGAGATQESKIIFTSEEEPEKLMRKRVEYVIADVDIASEIVEMDDSLSAAEEQDLFDAVPTPFAVFENHTGDEATLANEEGDGNKLLQSQSYGKEGSSRAQDPPNKGGLSARPSRDPVSQLKSYEVSLLSPVIAVARSIVLIPPSAQAM